MTEMWKAIPGFDGYDISDQGRVRSYYTPGRAANKNRIAWHIADDPRRIIKSSRGPDGYPRFNLQQNGKSHNRKAHSLVMLAFVGPRPDGHCVCHFNGNSADNRLSNLRYDTPAGNRADTARHRRERNQVPKKLISLRISKATEDKLRWLAERHGTQTEAVAVAIDRLYESDYNKERTMTGDRIDGAQLFEWFANDADHADVAKLEIEDITKQIHEVRSGDCTLPMTDLEIASSIKLHAQEHVAEFGA